MSAALALSPAHLSQRRFRALMDAFARPGTVHTLGEDLTSKGAMPQSAMAGLLALADFETAIFLSPRLAGDTALAADIRFETSARQVQDPALASFAAVDARHDGLILSSFHQGTPEYPDRSTTILVILESLSAGAGLTASGPGIKSTCRIAPTNLPEDFLAQWTANRAGFPLGVDLVFCAGTEIVALPRSIRLNREER